jgi:hypothetical protein
MESRDAVRMLCEPHYAIIGDQNVEREPLLDLLYQARYSSGGVKGVRSSNKGLPIDVGAITMYEDFDGRVRSRLEQYGISCIGDIKAVTERLHNTLVTINLEEGLDPREFDIFHQMVHRIEEFFDPPKEYEIMGECPECGATHVMNDDDEQARAIRIKLKPGHTLVAECVACEKLWAGNQEMVWLAQLLEANSDWDTLELMGVATQ